MENKNLQEMAMNLNPEGGNENNENDNTGGTGGTGTDRPKTGGGAGNQGGD